MAAASLAVAHEPRDHTKDKHAEKVLEERTVVVKGLGKHVTMSAVCAHLEQAGSIEEAKRVRKTAFVSFTTPRQAAWAVERLNNLGLQVIHTRTHTQSHASTHTLPLFISLSKTHRLCLTLTLKHKHAQYTNMYIHVFTSIHTCILKYICMYQYIYINLSWGS